MTGRLRPYEAIDELHPESFEAGELAPLGYRSLSIRFMGFFSSIEIPEMYAPPVNSDLSCPSTVAVQASSFEPALVMPWAVSSVSEPGCFAKITDPVILSVKIYVVDFVGRPSAVVKSPSYSVNSVSTPAPPKQKVATFAHRRAYHAVRSTASTFLLPPKNSCRWVINYVLTQNFYRYFRRALHTNLGTTNAS